jgi:hypothetical protein
MRLAEGGFDESVFGHRDIRHSRRTHLKFASDVVGAQLGEVILSHA